MEIFTYPLSTLLTIIVQMFGSPRTDTDNSKIDDGHPKSRYTETNIRYRYQYEYIVWVSVRKVWTHASVSIW